MWIIQKVWNKISQEREREKYKEKKNSIFYKQMRMNNNKYMYRYQDDWSIISHPFGNVWGAKNISAYDGGIAEYTDGVINVGGRWTFADDCIVRTDECNGTGCVRVRTIVVS
jgi:hypothetical protein